MALAILVGTIVGGAIGYVAFDSFRPRWTLAGSRALTHAPLSASGLANLTLAPGATILCQGDSLTQGTHSPGPYPAVLERLLGRGVTVVNQGYGGDTAADGLRRWADAPKSALTIIMYGTNDAAVRGPLGTRTLVPLAQYAATMEKLITRRQRLGSQVLVLASLPTAMPDAEHRLQPFRVAAREVAIRTGASFLDVGPALVAQRSPLLYDGIHLRTDASAAVAQGIAAILVPHLADQGRQ